MILFPAIDIIGGKVVRLEQGDYSRQSTYAGSPVEQAMQFEADGFTYLHLVDLDGAREGRLVNTEVVARICRETGLKVDAGGGIKTGDDARRLFDLGVEQINIGSMAQRAPEKFEELLNLFGPERIILSADVRNGRVAVNGWQDETDTSIEEIINGFRPHALTYVTCTDISKDGMLSGPSVDLYRKMIQTFPDIRVIASGGVADVADLIALKQIGCCGAITGKALLQGRFTSEELKSNQLL